MRIGWPLKWAASHYIVAQGETQHHYQVGNKEAPEIVNSIAHKKVESKGDGPSEKIVWHRQDRLRALDAPRLVKKSTAIHDIRSMLVAGSGASKALVAKGNSEKAIRAGGGMKLLD